MLVRYLVGVFAALCCSAAFAHTYHNTEAEAKAACEHRAQTAGRYGGYCAGPFNNPSSSNYVGYYTSRLYSSANQSGWGNIENHHFKTYDPPSCPDGQQLDPDDVCRDTSCPAGMSGNFVRTAP